MQNFMLVSPNARFLWKIDLICLATTSNLLLTIASQCFHCGSLMFHVFFMRVLFFIFGFSIIVFFCYLVLWASESPSVWERAAEGVFLGPNPLGPLDLDQSK